MKELFAVIVGLTVFSCLMLTNRSGSCENSRTDGSKALAVLPNRDEKKVVRVADDLLDVPGKKKNRDKHRAPNNVWNNRNVQIT